MFDNKKQISCIAINAPKIESYVLLNEVSIRIKNKGLQYFLKIIAVIKVNW